MPKTTRLVAQHPDMGAMHFKEKGLFARLLLRSSLCVAAVLRDGLLFSAL
jgi:hypothetical protein